MTRPKGNEVFEVFSCRFPSGLSARITTYAQLHRLRVRDVVIQAVLACLDDTHVAPLDTSATDVVRQAHTRIAEGLKLLGTVTHPSRSGVRFAPSGTTFSHPDGLQGMNAHLYFLGDVCEAQHLWKDTKQTVRRISDKKCVQCEKERKTRARESTANSAA